MMMTIQSVLVKTILSDLDIDVRQFPLNSIRSKISAAKNALLYPDDVEAQAASPMDHGGGPVCTGALQGAL